MFKDTKNGVSLYYIGGALITMMGFFLSLVVALGGLLNLVNVGEGYWAENLNEYKERFALYDDRGQITSYRYSEDELRVMFDEEKERSARRQRADATNMVIMGGVVMLVSGGVWWSFSKKLQSKG
jgi:hypothetical protein